MMKNIAILFLFLLAGSMFSQNTPTVFKIEPRKYDLGPQTLADLFEVCDLKLVTDKKHPKNLEVLMNYKIVGGVVSFIDKNILHEYMASAIVSKHLLDEIKNLPKNTQVYFERFDVTNPDGSVTRISMVNSKKN